MHLTRRDFLAGSAAVALSAVAGGAQQRRLFDSHFHIIDHRFPIVSNQGYTPPHFPLEAYLAQAKPLGVIAGAVVSGSFQANDQSYLIDALGKLGAVSVPVNTAVKGELLAYYLVQSDSELVVADEDLVDRQGGKAAL